ncbi:MAG: DUF308 domain-containing protein [Lachnospiraceae bacterium]|nr:DUF308 domain-containing protein [Lachnospiraceae bacterium]
MKMRSIAPIRIAKIGYIVMSVVFCIVGVLFVIKPDISLEVLTEALGIALVVFGAVKILGYFSKDLFRLAFQYDLEFGIVLLAMGVIVLIKPKEFTDFIFAAMGVAVLADSLFKIRIAFDSKRFGIESWPATLSLAILNVVIAIGLMFQPWEAAKVMTTLLGVSLLAEGILNLYVAVSMVKIVKHQYPDIVDENYRIVG